MAAAYLPSGMTVRCNLLNYPYRIGLGGVACCLLASCVGTGQLSGERAPLTENQEDAAMKALLGPEKFAEYVVIADTLESAEWLRQFWIAHDPTPTTPENEFRIEHERRIYHAIYLFGNPGKSGPPWDDRGEVYIRYGQPDERVIQQVGFDDGGIGSAPPEDASSDPFFNSPLNRQGSATEIWSYFQWNETFQFEDQRGLGSFEMVPVSDPAFRREHVGEFYSKRLRAIDLQPAIYYHEYGRNLIDYSLDVVRFRGEQGAWRVDVNLGYPLAQLGREADSVTISLDRTIIIRDEEQNEVFSEIGRIARLAPRSDGSNQLMIEQKIIDLKPGLYSVAVSIHDRTTGKTGTYLKSVRLPAYIVPEVQEISDIELASFVWSIYEPGSPFVKNGHMVMPLPSRVYLPDQRLAFYFEVYHLLLGEDGKSRYKIAYDINEVDGDAKKSANEPGELSTTTHDVVQFTSLDITDLPSGDYVLTVTVNDLIGKNEKSAVTRFSKSD